MTATTPPGEPVTIVRAPGGFVLTCSQWLPQPPAAIFPFVDFQVRGPYRRWHHTHRFTAENGGTRVDDRVEFGLPVALLHHTPVAAMIHRDVRRIFAYRQETLARRFSPAPASPGAS